MIDHNTSSHKKMIYKLALVLFFVGFIHAEDMVVFLKASNVTGFDTPMIPKYLRSLSGTVAVYKVGTLFYFIGTFIFKKESVAGILRINRLPWTTLEDQN